MNLVERYINQPVKPNFKGKPKLIQQYGAPLIAFRFMHADGLYRYYIIKDRYGFNNLIVYSHYLKDMQGFKESGSIVFDINDVPKELRYEYTDMIVRYYGDEDAKNRPGQRRWENEL